MQLLLGSNYQYGTYKCYKPVYFRSYGTDIWKVPKKSEFSIFHVIKNKNKNWDRTVRISKNQENFSKQYVKYLDPPLFLFSEDRCYESLIYIRFSCFSVQEVKSQTRGVQRLQHISKPRTWIWLSQEFRNRRENQQNSMA